MSMYMCIYVYVYVCICILYIVYVYVYVYIVNRSTLVEIPLHHLQNARDLFHKQPRW